MPTINRQAEKIAEGNILRRESNVLRDAFRAQRITGSISQRSRKKTMALELPILTPPWFAKIQLARTTGQSRSLSHRFRLHIGVKYVRVKDILQMATGARIQLELVGP